MVAVLFLLLLLQTFLTLSNFCPLQQQSPQPTTSTTINSRSVWSRKSLKPVIEYCHKYSIVSFKYKIETHSMSNTVEILHGVGGQFNDLLCVSLLGFGEGLMTFNQVFFKILKLLNFKGTLKIEILTFINDLSSK